MDSYRGTRIMVLGALCIALSTVLNYIKLFEMPQGGSVSLEMLPLLVFALTCGWKWGIGAGIVHGILQILLGGYFLSVPQILLDYPIAYGMVGLAGFFITPNTVNRVIGVLVGSLGRYVAAVLSGAVFFANYAPEGTSPWIYSMTYNGGYMSVNALICCVLIVLIMPQLRLKSRM